ncbi:MAG: NifB/NifX family molybdenum-iron cluster-binding protein [Bacillota bacterium]
MKLAITASSDQGLEASVDSRFGRAPYFTIVEVDTMETKVIKNSASSAGSGAGVSASQQLAEEEVDGVIAGNFGPKAFTSLQAGELKLYSYSGGTVAEAIDEFKRGTLNELSGPTNKAHTGLKNN